MSSTDSLPQIDTVDRFRQRFKDLFKGHCLSLGELKWLRTVFEKFGSSCDQSICWDISDLIEFLSATTPEELRLVLTAAGPLLYRCMVCLGSFPYHNVAARPLDFDTACVALIILLRRNDSHARFPPDYSGTNLEEELNEWHRIVLFQSMSSINTSRNDDCSFQPDREYVEDLPHNEHIRQAHTFLACSNSRRLHGGKTVVTGPPMISVSQLPSSQSRSFDRLIPKDEFRAILKLSIANQLYLSGNGPEVLALSGAALDNSTENIFNAFIEAHRIPTPTGICWKAFDKVNKTSTPHIFLALVRLIAPFVLDKGLSPEQFQTLTRAEALSEVRKAFAVSVEYAAPKPGSILNLSILAQLATFLPVQLPLEIASVLVTKKGNDLDLLAIERSICSRSQPLLLLASGYLKETISTAAHNNGHVCFGVYFPDNPRHYACLFELEPIHRVFWSGLANEQQAEFLHVTSDDGNASVVKAEIRTPDGELIRFILEEGLGNGLFSVQETGQDNAAILRAFNLEVVELIGFPSGVTTLDLPMDYTFYVREDIVING